MSGGTFDTVRKISTLSHASWNRNLAPCLRVPVADGAAFIHSVAATFDEVLAACEVVSCFLETCTQFVFQLIAQRAVARGSDQIALLEGIAFVVEQFPWTLETPGVGISLCP